MKFQPIWFDSLGAKAASCFIETDVKIVIDPGAAIMHPSFPASYAKKLLWLKQAERKIKAFCKKAEILTISHYHYDHYFPDDIDVYKNKTVLVKNPNEYINFSQRERALSFFQDVYKKFYGKDIEFAKARKKYYEDPFLSLKIARRKNFGTYKKRRQELLEKGKSLFMEWKERWNKEDRIKEITKGKTKFIFADGKNFKFGKTKISFSKPLFHGIEYSNVGFVISIIIKYGKEKLLYTSDINGPIIEDYAEFIIKENPSLLVIDGPATYMIPYTLNMINFRRALENLKKIVKECSSSLIILDHHLTRDKLYLKRLKPVYNLAARLNKKLLTAAEVLGKKAVVLK